MAVVNDTRCCVCYPEDLILVLRPFKTTPRSSLVLVLSLRPGVGSRPWFCKCKMQPVIFVELSSCLMLQACFDHL